MFLPSKRALTSPKSPSAESADEFLIVRKPYVFTVKASPDPIFVEISDVLFCERESQGFWKCILFILDVLLCEPESQNFRKCISWDVRRFVLRTGTQEILKVYCLRFPTLVLGTRVPTFLKVHLQDFRRLLCEPESHNFWKCMIWHCWRYTLQNSQISGNGPTQAAAALDKRLFQRQT